MTEPRARHTVLQIALPALIVVIGYTATIGRRTAIAIDEAEQQVDMVSESMPMATAIEAARRERDALSDAVAELRARQQQHSASASEAKGGGASGLDAAIRRLRAASRLTSLVATCGLELVEERFDVAPVPPDLRKRLERLDATAVDGPRVRSLRIRGAYLDVLRLLEAIAKEDVGVVPLHCRMGRGGPANADKQAHLPTAAPSARPLATWELDLWI